MSVLICVWIDCPQVQAVCKFVAHEPDELSLEESDVVNVIRKLPDGKWLILNIARWSASTIANEVESLT